MKKRLQVAEARRVEHLLLDIARVHHWTGLYDALRTNRPHRASLDRETALGILREGRGTEFEPAFLDRFLRMVS